jgi:hypothetical protein
MYRRFDYWPATVAGRDIVTNVPDLFGGLMQLGYSSFVRREKK